MRRILFLLTHMLVFLGIQAYAQSVVICVTANGNPVPSDKNVILCRNDTITLRALNCASTPETNLSYKWNNIDVSPFTDSVRASVLAAHPGRWVITITNNVTSAITRDTIILSHPPAIGVTLNDAPLPPVCPLVSQTITGTPSGPVVSYQWYEYTPAGVKILLSGQTNSSYTFTKKMTKYILEVKDINGCINSEISKTLGQSNALIIDLPDDTIIICEDVPVSLQSVSPSIGYGVDSVPSAGPNGYEYFYRLVNSAGNFLLTPPTISYEIVPPSYTTTPSNPNSMPIIGINKYVLRVGTSGFTCPNADTLVVIVRPKPAFTYRDTLLCAGAAITMIPTITDGAPVTGYSWSPATGLSNASIGQPVVSGLPGNQTYNITASNTCGSSVSSVLVTYNPPISISLSNDTTICITPAGTASLSGSASGGVPGSPTPYHYQWSSSGLTGNPTTSSIVVTPTVTTSYALMATDANNCTNTRSVSVHLYGPPIPEIPSPQVINEDFGTVLDAAGPGNAGMSFLWKTDNSPIVLSTRSSLSLEYLGPDTTFYVAIVMDPSNGCLSSDTVAIHSISNNTLMFVPNVFSPNAMNSENQTLKIYGDNLLADDFKWLVFNKWGNIMYETTNLIEAQYQGWNGGDMPQGVYSYVIIGKFKNGKDIKESNHYKGTFTLIR